MTNPAQDATAEQAVLGAVLLNNSVFAEINGLRPEHFYRPNHAAIFSTMSRMHAHGVSADAVTVAAELDRDGDLIRVGGAPYVHTLLTAIPTVTNAAHYAKIVMDKWKIRRLNELGQRFQQIHDTADEIPEALDAARSFLSEMDGDPSAPEGFLDLYESWKTWMETDSPAIATPWDELNQRVGGGFHRQHLYVIGARSGTGKTILLSQSALHSAQLHRKAAFFSLELPKEVLMGRLLSAGARVPYAEIVQRRLSPGAKGKLDSWIAASGELQSHLHVDDRCSMTIEDIARECRSMKRSDGLDVIFIDYAQRLRPSNRRVGREEQVAHIFQEAKTLARETDTAVVLAAQLNREIEREKRMPRKSDFRESGAAEQEADVALILTRAGDAAHPLVNFSLVKNRLGIEETFQLQAHFKYQRFGQ